jgi:pimeloyl-ACP methyl ester carboxylesterase
MIVSARLERPRPPCRACARAAGVSLVAALGWLAQAAAPAPSAHPIGLRSMDGTPIAADLYEPRLQPAPAVVLVHMLTRTRLDWAATAERLQDAGFAALSLDLRGHGQSGGGLDSGGDLSPMQRDVAAAVAFLKSRGVKRIGIAGASLGANLAALVAVTDPTIRSLALLSASTDYRGLRIEAALRKVDCPVLLVAGSNDPYALRSAMVLAASGGRREIVTLPDAGHGTTMLVRQPELTSRLMDWFRRTLL